MSSFGTRLPGVYVIGLTGGIATGKSTVSAMLRDLGAMIIDADEISHQVTAKGSPGLGRVVEIFGEGVLDPEGSLNRKSLGKIIFRNEEARQELEAIIHPLVMGRVAEVLNRLSREATGDGRTRVAVLDAPLLFEAGAERVTDEVWVVVVDRKTQVRRLMRREGFGREEADFRIDVQMPLEEKVRRATETIDNQGDIRDTREQVLSLWDSVKRKISG